MGRRKKKSAALLKAQQRLAGIRSIDPKLDLGNGVSVASFTKDVDSLRVAIDNYNALLSTVDDAANAIEKQEQQIVIAAENVLLSVKVKFGKDSSQYEMAGGTRLSDRRRSPRLATTAPSTATASAATA
ncbi:MAG: hypothetical protein WA885_19095 [Phormidesmis sp.]